MLFFMHLGVWDKNELSNFHGATESSCVELVPIKDCTRLRNIFALGAKTKLALLLLALTGRELRRPVFTIDILPDKLLSMSSAFF